MVKHLQKSHMLINSKISKMPFWACIFLSTKLWGSELVCNVNADCNRFDYTSEASFNASVVNYAVRQHLNDPTLILSRIAEANVIHISSIDDGLILIDNNPIIIYAIGRYIKKNKKPPEWLYIFEQSFLRKFNNLGR